MTSDDGSVSETDAEGGGTVSDGDAPTGDPDLADHEQPDTAQDQSADEREDTSPNAPVDADEGDPPSEAYPG